MKKFERFFIYPLLFVALFYIIVGNQEPVTNAEQVFDELIAKKVTIVNNKGAKIIDLSSTKDNCGMILTYDDKENCETILSSSPYGGYLGICSMDETAAMISVSDEGTGVIRTNNKYGQTSVLIYQTEQKNGGVFVFDKYGEEYVTYTYNK